MYQALPFKDVLMPCSFQQRVLFFDPSQLYARVNIQANARRQTSEDIGMKLMFPKQPGFCACGCGRALKGKRTKWAADDCSNFAADIYRILYGQLDTIKFYLKIYHGYKCKCGRVRKMKVDHIIPVKHGGGGCWLSNYQFLCHKCHVEKTNSDFGWNRSKVNFKKEDRSKNILNMENVL